jgi:hypothetical protein
MWKARAGVALICWLRLCGGSVRHRRIASSRCLGCRRLNDCCRWRRWHLADMQQQANLLLANLRD